jgi:GNAT superfamily N-acetyltransferase
VASSNSLMVDYDRYEDWHDWREIADAGFIRNHDPEGDTLYGIEIMVDPEFRGMHLARRLYDARKELCRRSEPGAHRHRRAHPGLRRPRRGMTAREYVEKVIARGALRPGADHAARQRLRAQGAHPRLLPVRQARAATRRTSSGPTSTTCARPQRSWHRCLFGALCAVQYQMRASTVGRSSAASASTSSTRPRSTRPTSCSSPSSSRRSSSGKSSASAGRADACAAGRAHAGVPRASSRAGGQVQRQRHRRLAVHDGRGRPLLQRRLPVPARRHHRAAAQAARHAGRAALVGRRARRQPRSSTPIAARSRSSSATTSSSPSSRGSRRGRARRSSSCPSTPTDRAATCACATAPRPGPSRTTSSWPSPAARATSLRGQRRRALRPVGHLHAARLLLRPRRHRRRVHAQHRDAGDRRRGPRAAPPPPGATWADSKVVVMPM